MKLVPSSFLLLLVRHLLLLAWHLFLIASLLLLVRHLLLLAMHLFLVAYVGGKGPLCLGSYLHPPEGSDRVVEAFRRTKVLRHGGALHPVAFALVWEGALLPLCSWHSVGHVGQWQHRCP